MWAAAGSRVEGGGTLIAKNRDRRPQRTALQLFTPPGGYKYLGLVGVDSPYKPVVAGVNEKGLVMVDATASTVPKAQREEGDWGQAKVLLAQCATVEEVLARKDLLTASHPIFHLVADGHRIALIEIAPGGKMAVKTQTQGVMYHTNHYLDHGLQEANGKPYASTFIRLSRISQLLAAHLAPFTLPDFLQFSRDRQGGPDNCINRTGSRPGKIRTIATWIVAHPRAGSPRLHLSIFNPGEAERNYDLPLDAAFWQKGRLQ